MVLHMTSLVTAFLAFSVESYQSDSCRFSLIGQFLSFIFAVLLLRHAYFHFFKTFLILEGVMLAIFAF